MLGIELNGVRVIAAGGCGTATWQSTGIDYAVEVRSDALADQLAHPLQVVDQWTRLAEILTPFEPELPSGGSPWAGPGKSIARSAAT